MPVFLSVLLVHSSVTLVLTITLSQFAHLSSSFIPGHLHISYLCVPMFVWRVSMFICASMCVLVCRPHWSAISGSREMNVSVQLSPFFLFSPGPFPGCFQSHPEGVFFLHLTSSGNNTLRHSQASFYDDLRLSIVESKD